MIKYECDICGDLNVTADTFGPGVFAEAPEVNGFKLGVAMRWWKDIAGSDGFTEAESKLVFLEVMPSIGGNEASQICGACVKLMLLEMIKEKWPSEDDPASDGADPAVREVPTEQEVHVPRPDECGDCGRPRDLLAPTHCKTPLEHRTIRSSRGGPGED